MKKNLPLDEQIIKQKKKLREKRVFNTILIVLLSLTLLYTITTTINYIFTNPKFKNELEVTMHLPQGAEEWIIVYKNKEYTYDEYIQYNNAEGLFTSGKVIGILFAPVLTIGIIILSTKIKNNKDILNNLLLKQSHEEKFTKKEDELKLQKLQNEIENNKSKYCQYCGSKTTSNTCQNCGAKFHTNN